MSDSYENTHSYNSAKRRIIAYLFVVTLFIVFLTLFANTWVSEQKVNKIVVKGNSFIPTNELFAMIKDDTTGVDINNISLFNLKRTIEQHPYVKEAFVIKRNTSTIEIEVVERFPKGILVNNNGELEYVDNQLSIMPYRLSLKFTDLPVLQGYFLKNRLDSTSLKNALNILQKINESSVIDVSELNFSRKTKEYTLISSNYPYPIKLGKMVDVSHKLKKIKALVPIMGKSLSDKELSYIDLRWKDKVILSYNDINFLD